VDELTAQFVNGGQRVNGSADPAQHSHGMEGNRELQTVRATDRQDVAFAETASTQPERCATDRIRQRAVG
jgi:hypothetical protein